MFGLIKFVENDIAKMRYEICKGDSVYHPCENYIRLTGQCKKCGCFLKAKTKIYKRGGHIEKCPINKW
jgi:hypothetical protein